MNRKYTISSIRIIQFYLKYPVRGCLGASVSRKIFLRFFALPVELAFGVVVAFLGVVFSGTFSSGFSSLTGNDLLPKRFKYHFKYKNEQ